MTKYYDLDFEERLEAYRNMKNNQEELEPNENKDEWVGDLIEGGYNLYKITKRRIFTRGFIMGALVAVAIQCIITILVLLK